MKPFHTSNSLHRVEEVSRVVDLEIVNGNDVGVFEVSRDAGFASESLLVVGRGGFAKGFGGNDSVESFVVDLKNLTHAPDSQDPLDLVTA